MAIPAAVEAGLDRLAASFRGTLLTPRTPGYWHARRVHNAMVDRRPALIAQCTCTEDVVAALAFARDADLPVAVRSGGHSVRGYGVCDDGVVIDVAPMKRIVVDVERRVARAQAGLTWGEFDHAAGRHGLATTGGRVSSTGLGGLITGSGSGWLERMYGLSADNLLSAEVVTADGVVLRAGESRHPDLFWAIRGGGGNFGVVTSFELQLHPVETVYAGMLLYPFAQASEVVPAYRDVMVDAPDEVLGALAFVTAPPAPFVPRALQGKPVVGIIAGWVGDASDGAEALRPLVAAHRPAAGGLEPMPYTGLQRMLDASNPPGFQHYWTAENLHAVDDAEVDVLVERAGAIRSPFTQFLLQPLGGAYARVADDATPLGDRDAPWMYHAIATWWDPGDGDTHIAWARDTAAALRPFTRPGVPLNFTSDTGGDRVRRTYGTNYDRLVRVKDNYDPDNVFHHNQNIAPSGSAP